MGGGAPVTVPSRRGTAGTPVARFAWRPVAGFDGWLADRFSSCRVSARLDNRIGVDNEDQGEPVHVCRGPLRPWPQLWVDFKRLS
jgi:hypothetical protein